MTGKERILKAFSKAGEADRVPFSVGLGNVDLISLSGLDNREYEKQGRTMLSDLVYWSDRLGFDFYHYLGGIPEANPSRNCKIEKFELEDENVKIIRTKVSTSVGEIWQQRLCRRFDIEFTNSKFIKDIARDWPVFREYFGYEWAVDAKRFYDDYGFVGDRGVLGVVVHTPVDFWQEYRDGGPEQMIFDFLDDKRIMEEFCEYYTQNCMGYLETVSRLDPKPDFVMLHGSNCSGSLISPDIFKGYALPFIKKSSEFLKGVGIPSMLHICGKCNEWLDLIADTEVSIMDALEHAPAGNVDLSEVKKLYGDKFCLKGNVSAIKMATGSREEIRSEVKGCIEAAAKGGGFFLDVGDSIGPQVKLENLEEFVSAATEYGKY